MVWHRSWWHDPVMLRGWWVIAVAMVGCQQEGDATSSVDGSAGAPKADASASGSSGGGNAGVGDASVDVMGGTAGVDAALDGSAGCTEPSPWNGGAVHYDPKVPVNGSPCPVEDFQLCTPEAFSPPPHPKTLSKCVAGSWQTVESPSECATSSGVFDYECNVGKRTTGECCDKPRLCEICQGSCSLAFCDGRMWHVYQ